MGIVESYNPYGATLYAHQRQTIYFVLNNVRCFVNDDMGTGKTMSLLSVIDILRSHKKISKALVVCPLSVMGNWSDHLVKFFPHMQFVILHGPKAKRIERIQSKFTVAIINGDGIKTLEDEIHKAKFDMVIWDESTMFSYHTSQRSKCAWRIARTIKSSVPMSGDFLPNDLLQCYSQMKLVDHNRIKYFTRFRDEIKYKLNMYSYIDKENAIDTVNKYMTPIIRHKLEECIDLPEVVFEDRFPVMPIKIKRLYNEMKKEYITFLESGETVTSATAAVKYMKLLQISAGIIIDNDGNYIDLDSKFRLNEIESVFEQAGQLLVFAEFTAVVDSIVKHFNATKIDGSVNKSKRDTIITDFQNGKIDMLVAQIRTVSHGLNFQNCSHILHATPTLSGERYWQANARVRRPGQKNIQVIHHLISSPAERLVYSALKKKKSTSDAFMRGILNV